MHKQQPLMEDGHADSQTVRQCSLSTMRWTDEEGDIVQGYQWEGWPSKKSDIDL